MGSQAEGVFMVHCLPTAYSRRIDSAMAKQLEPSVALVVAKALNWLEQESENHGGRLLAGDTVTTADTMVNLTIHSIFAQGLARSDRSWDKAKRLLKNVEGEEAYRKIVAKTGHKLG